MLGVLGSEQADLVDARTYRPSVDLQAFIDANKSLVGLLLPDKVHRVLQHSELWCRLYQVAGNTRRVETIRITGIFQRIDRLLEARSGYGYAVSNTLASWKLGGCRRPTAWLSYDQAQELWGDFCDKFIRADTTESLKTSLTIEAESYFQQADGAFIVKPEYDADPILQQIVRAISLLPEEPVVFEGVRSTLQEDGCGAAFI